jgi:hypothetical protein
MLVWKTIVIVRCSGDVRHSVNGIVPPRAPLALSREACACRPAGPERPRTHWFYRGRTGQRCTWCRGATTNARGQRTGYRGMTLGLAGLIPFVRTGLVRFISGTTVVFTVGWEAGLMENPIPLATLHITMMQGYICVLVSSDNFANWSPIFQPFKLNINHLYALPPYRRFNLDLRSQVGLI